MKKMKKADLKEHCDRIANFFDEIPGRNDQQVMFSDYCLEESGYYKLRPQDIEEDDPWYEMATNLFAMAFSLGFVIGQTTDICRPEIQESVKVIQETIRKEELLPYLPREKKAA